MHSSPRISILALSFLLLGGLPSRAGNPSQGLWVGEVALNAVNQATGAVGDSNTYVFEDPEITTPTSDTAFLRLILHVNGAGQVRLLKSVAVVEGGTLPDGSSDVLLITDPMLYPSYAGIAKRIATAFYDFGDPQAFQAVQELIDTAVETAVDGAIAGDIRSVIEDDALDALGGVVDGADAGGAYLDRGTGAMSFLTDDFFDLTEVQAIADAVTTMIGGGSVPSDFAYTADPYEPFTSPPTGFAATVTAAKALRDDSFYGDSRGIDAIVGIVVAAAEAAAADPAQANVYRAAEAAWHNAADVGQAYNMFLASSVFSGLPAFISGTDLTTGTLSVAVQEGLDALGRGELEADIIVSVEDALLAETPVMDAITAAETVLSESLWGDSRGRQAIDALIESAATTAAAQVVMVTVPDNTSLMDAVATAVEDAFNGIESGPVFASTPSTDYTDFVTGTDYETAADIAAATAASEAHFQFHEGGFTEEDELTFLTRRAVSKALIFYRNQAAALPQNSMPLSGSLAAGGAVSGEIYLPALAPTNPFLHRLHPDHAEGFSITRRISMTVSSSDFERAGYGVSRLSGTYEEEIFGLHKALGNSQDVGLKTQGSFTLNRLSLVDSLNF